MDTYNVKVTHDAKSHSFGAQCADIGLFVEHEDLDSLLALAREIGPELAAANGIPLRPESLVFTYYAAPLRRDLIIPAQPAFA
jgi:hypothetical protein